MWLSAVAQNGLVYPAERLFPDSYNKRRGPWGWVAILK